MQSLLLRLIRPFPPLSFPQLLPRVPSSPLPLSSPSPGFSAARPRRLISPARRSVPIGVRSQIWAALAHVARPARWAMQAGPWRLSSRRSRLPPASACSTTTTTAAAPSAALCAAARALVVPRASSLSRASSRVLTVPRVLARPRVVAYGPSCLPSRRSRLPPARACSTTAASSTLRCPVYHRAYPCCRARVPASSPNVLGACPPLPPVSASYGGGADTHSPTCMSSQFRLSYIAYMYCPYEHFRT